MHCYNNGLIFLLFFVISRNCSLRSLLVFSLSPSSPLLLPAKFIFPRLELVVTMHLLEPAAANSLLEVRPFVAGEGAMWWEGSYDGAVPEGPENSTFKYRSYAQSAWDGRSALDETHACLERSSSSCSLPCVQSSPSLAS